MSRWFAGFGVVAAALTLSVSTPAFAGITIGPEFQMNGDTVGAGPALDQVNPAIAHDPVSDTYYAAWKGRDSWGSTVIYGARVREDGEVLDLSPFVLCAPPTDCGDPRIAYQGGMFLAVWGTINGDVLGRRVYATGGYPTGSILPIAVSGYPEYEPTVAGAAGKFVVVYPMTITTSEIPLWATEVTPGGSILRRIPVIEEEGPFTRFGEPSMISLLDSQGAVHFDIAFRASDGLNKMIWELYSTSADLTQGGFVLEALTGTNGCGDPHHPSIGAIGPQTLMVFTQLCPDGSGNYLEDLFASQGNGNWATNLTSTPTTYETSPSLVGLAADDSFWLAWDAYDVNGAQPRRPVLRKMTRYAGFLGQLVPRDAAAASTAPGLATNGRALLVAWGDARNAGAGQDLFASRVSTELEDLDPTDLLVSSSAAHAYLEQEEPAVASQPDVSLVVWTDRRDGSSGDIYATRVDRYGQVLDPKGIPVSATVYPEGSPAVATNGKDFFVVWDTTDRGPDKGRIQGAVVLADGTVGPVVDLSRTDVDMWAEDPAVTFVREPDVYVVAWQADYGNKLDVFGVAVETKAELAFPGSEIEICVEPNDQSRVALGGGRGFAIAAWEEEGRGHASVNVFGAKLRSWNAFWPGKDSELTAELDYKAPGDQHWPAVACDPDGNLELCAVTVSSAPNGADSADLVALRAEVPWGQDDVYVKEFFPISEADHAQVESALAFDKDHYFVAWEDHRGGYPAIYGARFVLEKADVWDPDGFRISLDLDPAVGCTSNEHYLAVDTQATWGIHRTVGRLIEP